MERQRNDKRKRHYTGHRGGIILLAMFLLFALMPQKVKAEQYLGDDISKAIMEMGPFDEEKAEQIAKELQSYMKEYELQNQEELSSEGEIPEGPAEVITESGDQQESTQESDPAAPKAPEMEILEAEEFFAKYGSEESFLEELDPDREPSDEEQISAEGVSLFYTERSAVEYIKNMMVKRKTKIVFDMQRSSDLDQLMSLKKVRTLPYEDSLFTKPVEGDYLFWHTAAWKVGYQMISGNRVRYYVYVKYFSTAAQEKYVDTFINAFITRYGLSNATDQEKIRIVYWFMTKYIKYDFYHLRENPDYNPMRSAYGAVHDGTAVCQGYANLFYRMMRKMGVSTRVVTSESHAWNIVALGGRYYNVDTTWDSGYTSDDTARLYRFFMKTDQDMLVDDEHGSEHVREASCSTAEYYAEYPMTQMSYPVSLWYYGSLLGSIDQLNELTEVVEGGVPEGALYTTFPLTGSRVSNRTATLSWGACEGAVRYDVYGKRDGENFMWLASTSDTSIELKLRDSATTRYYVAAADSTEHGCGISKTICIPGGEMYAKVGLSITDGTCIYRITASNAKKRTVTLTKWSGIGSTMGVPDTIVFDGLRYKVDRIGSKVVKKKGSLKTVLIGSNVKTIDKNAFSGCRKLIYVEIRGKALKKVGKNAFAKTASKLTVICSKKKKKKYMKLISKAKKGGNVVYGKL